MLYRTKHEFKFQCSQTHTLDHNYYTILTTTIYIYIFNSHTLETSSDKLKLQDDQ